MLRPAITATPVRTVLLAFGLLLAFATPSFSASTVGAWVADDPTEDVPIAVEISGTADDPLRLFVYVRAAESSCATTAQGESERGSAALGDAAGALVSGEFLREFAYVPPDSGNFRVCAYLAVAADDLDPLVTSRPFGVRAPTSTLALSTSGDPTEDVELTVFASGTSEVPRRLFVFVQPATSACDPNLAIQLAGTAVSLTPRSGEPVGPGDYTYGADFTAPDDRTYRLCGYLAESGSSEAESTQSTPFVTRAARASLSLSGPSSPAKGVAATVTATGQAEAARRLFVYAQSAAVTCPPTAPASGAALPGSGVAVGPGPFSGAVQFTPAEAGTTYRLCGYVVESGAPAEAVATLNLTSAAAAPAPQPQQPGTLQPPASQQPTQPAAPQTQVPLATPAVPTAPAAKTYRALLTTDETDQFDRLELTWTTDGEPDDERVEIWDEDPAEGSSAVVSAPVDDEDEFDLTYGVGQERVLAVRHHLGYRQFWWRVITTTPGGDAEPSEIRRVRVVPSPMDKGKVRVSAKLTQPRSSTSSGKVRLRIASSPRARVSLIVSFRGRVVAKRNYVEGVGALRGVEFTLSCAQTGRFSYEAKIADPYGDKVTRRGHWTSSASRCGRLRAAELAKRRAAEARKRAAEQRKRAAEQRRRDRENAQPPASSGGGGCDPNYRGACLDPNASDYDCEGGSGDGPLYVSGPISVVGTDHYDLDRDGNGVACES